MENKMADDTRETMTVDALQCARVLAAEVERLRASLTSCQKSNCELVAAKVEPAATWQPSLGDPDGRSDHCGKPEPFRVLCGDCEQLVCTDCGRVECCCDEARRVDDVMAEQFHADGTYAGAYDDIHAQRVLIAEVRRLREQFADETAKRFEVTRHAREVEADRDRLVQRSERAVSDLRLMASKLDALTNEWARGAREAYAAAAAHCAHIFGLK
jgi:hypothetical protein